MTVIKHSDAGGEAEHQVAAAPGQAAEGRLEGAAADRVEHHVDTAAPGQLADRLPPRLRAGTLRRLERAVPAGRPRLRVGLRALAGACVRAGLDTVVAAPEGEASGTGAEVSSTTVLTGSDCNQTQVDGDGIQSKAAVNANIKAAMLRV